MHCSHNCKHQVLTPFQNCCVTFHVNTCHRNVFSLHVCSLVINFRFMLGKQSGYCHCGCKIQILNDRLTVLSLEYFLLGVSEGFRFHCSKCSNTYITWANVCMCMCVCMCVCTCICMQVCTCLHVTECEHVLSVQVCTCVCEWGCIFEWESGTWRVCTWLYMCQSKLLLVWNEWCRNATEWHLILIATEQ